jgi:class 3 adenylate cyclase
MEPVPDTRYAVAPDGAYIAYQTVGQGPVDLVWQSDWLSNFDINWEYPSVKAFFLGLTSFARVIQHDRRATGASSRNVEPPNLETRVADLRLVLDAVGSERAVLGADFEGGAPNVLFAATYPDRVRALVWWSPSPTSDRTPDYPWGYGPDEIEAEERTLLSWGTSGFGHEFLKEQAATGHVIPDEFSNRLSKHSRQTCTPDVARELTRIWHETDVRGVLPAVRAPTLLIAHAGAEGDVESSEYIASLMPRAEVATFEGQIEPSLETIHTHVDRIRRFIGIDAPATSLDSVLATIVFTDIVGSTEKQASIGDHAWKGLVEGHHDVVRQALRRWRGDEIDTAGDGFFATFDGPARAIRCALEAVDHVRDLGIEVRAGVHTGECELINGKVGGLAVSIGARVAAKGGPSEVLVSQTVKDLVAGSGFTFHEAGEHELKGVPDRWRLYRVVS